MQRDPHTSLAKDSGPILPPAAAPALLFGMGIGGFVDGIVLHQLLQWHHMLSHTEGGNTKTVAGLELNTLADGLFHSAMWILVVAAAALAVRARRERRGVPGRSYSVRRCGGASGTSTRYSDSVGTARA